MKNWIQNSIVTLIIAIITWIITVVVTLAVAKQELGNHIDSKDVHMPFEKKLEKFVGRPEYNLHMIQSNKRFDRIDAMLIKIYDKE